MKLRMYQWSAVWETVQQMIKKPGEHPLIVKPTGTGKSLVIAGLVRYLLENWPHVKILSVTHVKELIEQNHAKLEQFWPECPAGIYSSALNRRDLYHNPIFCGIGSVYKKADSFGKVDFLIIDEAHLVNVSAKTMYRKFIEDLEAINPNLIVIGLTATPWRLGLGLLTDEDGFFDYISYDISTVEEFNKLIREGYLMPLIPMPTETKLDVDGVHTRGGEFIEKELQLAVDKEGVTRAALKETIQVAQEQNRCSWLIFTTGIEHAEHVKEYLTEYGVNCDVVHGGNKDYKLTASERDQRIADHKSGKLTALINANILTTGYDNPNIDLIVMLRPSQSPVLWVQMLGRGTRPAYAPGHDLETYEGRMAAIEESHKQNCMVLDFAGNTRRLGPINDPVRPQKKGKGGGEAPIKDCPKCGAMNHASARFCINQPFCDHEFQFEVKITKHASSDELVVDDVAPVIEVFKVDKVFFSPHQKPGRPLSIRVSYRVGLRKYDEYIGFEHTDYLGVKATNWWKLRSTEPVPTTTKEALERMAHVKHSTHIRVQTNAKHPIIMAHCFDGTAFGTQEAKVGSEPEIQVVQKNTKIPNKFKRTLAS